MRKLTSWLLKVRTNAISLTSELKSTDKLPNTSSNTKIQHQVIVIPRNYDVLAEQGKDTNQEPSQSTPKRKKQLKTRPTLQYQDA